MAYFNPKTGMIEDTELEPRDKNIGDKIIDKVIWGDKEFYYDTKETKSL